VQRWADSEGRKHIAFLGSAKYQDGERITVTRGEVTN
jgi:hypothetical protein